jgi:uncharacterized protein (TIRG00374 family)
MNQFMKQMIKFLPLALGIIILSIGALFVPWHEVGPYLGRLKPMTYLLILVLGTAFYVVRAVRYHYMLRVLDMPRSFRRTLVAYLEAQPISLLPGGEAFRTVTLKKQVKVPLDNGVPVVFLQSFTENIGLIILALISALVLRQQAILIFIAAIIYVLILVLLRTRRTAEHSRRLLNKLPFVNLARHKFLKFIKKNHTLLSGSSLVVLLITGLLSSFFASALVLVIAHDMGISLTIPEAVIAFSLPAVLQNMTFLPGGIGVNEQSSVGVLILLGAHFPAAVALTIVMRLVTLGLGVILGLGAILLAKFHPRLES